MSIWDLSIGMVAKAVEFGLEVGNSFPTVYFWGIWLPLGSHSTSFSAGWSITGVADLLQGSPDDNPNFAGFSGF